MSTQQTFNDMLDSLTGYEEQAITQEFGDDISTLLATNATFSGRALIFVDHKRKGKSNKDAKKAAMDLTLKDVNGYFAEDAEEVDEEQPVTEQGKGADAGS